MRRPGSVLLLAAALTACSGDRAPVADPAASTAVDGATTVPERADDLDAWCGAARDVRSATLGMDAVDPTDAAGVEAALAEMIARTETAADVAPSEIADDVGAVLDLMQQLDRVLAEVDYDFLEADPAGIVAADGADEANARIDAFNAEHCALDPVDDETADATSPLDRDALRQQAIDVFVEQGFTAEEAACLFDNMDLDDPGLATDEEAMLELIQVCDLDLERLAGTTGGDG